MGSFLYYIPGADPGKAANVAAESGLAYAVDGPITPCGVARGPSGESGVVLALTSARGDMRVGYYPDDQLWRKVPGNAHGVYVGIDRTRTPTPDSLRRPVQLEGVLVTLADGCKWLVPQARRFAMDDGNACWRCVLPRIVDVDESGAWVLGDVHRANQALWKVAERYGDARMRAIDAAGESAGSVEIDYSDEELLDAVSLALAVNYRVGRVEIGLLGILTNSLAVQVMDVVTDFTGALEAMREKKSEALA